MLPLAPDLAARVLDAAPDAMIVIDASGHIRFANRQVSVLFGYEHDELIGRNAELLMPERFRQRHMGHRESYANQVRVRPMGVGLELFGRQRDGKEFPVEISLSPIAERGQMLVAAAIRDVSDRKRAEFELIEAREAADRASQGKSRFLATASHDLRQPLQTLALLNGSLRRIVRDADADEALLQQEQAVRAMSRLLNALLDISKLESGAIKPEPTDFRVATLFEELRREFDSIAASKGLQLQIESCAHAVHSDPSLVGQILRNLVSNAIKYTHRGWVHLRCLHEATAVRIEVLDTGIGIPADLIPHIYDEFYQVSSSSDRSRDGYGLGLSIVQRLARLLALELEVRSEVGRGSVFSVLLPAGASHTKADPTNQRRRILSTARSGRCHVLLVEDDFAVRRATRMLLEVEGYAVTAVGSLREALEAASNATSVDLLITDYHLGDAESGVQVIGALRERLGPSLKAVLMTGDTSSAVKELPLDPSLRTASKPINADELLSLVTMMLTSDRAGSAGSDELKSGLPVREPGVARP